MSLTKNKNMSNRFSKKESLIKGQQKRNRLIELVQNFTQIRQTEKYPHLYMYSPPGLGKTFTVNQYLNTSKTLFFTVSGNTSMFAFGIQLAVINYQISPTVPIIIYVDDCDEIFKNEQNCNTMKNVLDGEKIFVYERSLASQMSNLSDLQKSAIEYYNEDGKMGFSVPTDNLRFIFTSNFRLPIDDEVRDSRNKGKRTSVLMAHKNAIRSRCKVADFDLSPDEHWGWISDVVLNTDCLDKINLSEFHKGAILEFMRDNWSRLTERSIRSIEKLGEIINSHPEDYETIWEIDYLKNDNHGY